MLSNLIVKQTETDLEGIIEAQLIDSDMELKTSVDFKIRPPYLAGELQPTIYHYPTNGLAGLL